jgi:hypothetical protein
VTRKPSMPRTLPLLLLLLPACARSHVCAPPRPEEPSDGPYHWQAWGGDCVPYHATVTDLDGVMPDTCAPVDWCGDSGTFSCPVPTGTLVYDVVLWWDGADLVGEGTVTRLDADGAETCAGDVTIEAHVSAFD